MSTTSDAIKAVRIAHAVAEAIRELGEIPSGHLYARLMGVLEHLYGHGAKLLAVRRLEEDASERKPA